MKAHLVTLVVLMFGLMLPGAVLGQSDALPEPLEGTASVRFSIAGPLSPEATELVLLAADRSCGVGFSDQQFSSVHAAETGMAVAIRLDVAIGPSGTSCPSRSLVRVPVSLDAPLGERSIRNAGSDPETTPLVNLVDPIDTGFRYSCDGVSSSVADLLGPGLDVAGNGPRSLIADARAIVDTGDVIEFLAPIRAAIGADWEAWWFHEGRWDRNAWGTCRPRVVLSPGLDGSTWTLRGSRPGPRSRQIKVWVDQSSCSSGRSPAGRIARPIIQVRRDSIVIIVGVKPFGGTQECQSAPAAPFVVKLPVARGDRALYDGGVFPPRELVKSRR